MRLRGGRFAAAIILAAALLLGPAAGRARAEKFGQMARIHFVGTWFTLHKAALDSSFTAIPLRDLNKMVFAELSKLGGEWKVYSSDDAAGVRDDDVQLAVVVSRADANENYYADLYGEGDLYKYLVDVGTTLVFFNSFSKEILYTRTLTGELPHIDKTKISAAKRTELFRDCFKQTLAGIFPKAYADYNPTWVKGKIVAVKGGAIETDLGFTKGALKNAVLHYDGGSLGVEEVSEKGSRCALKPRAKKKPEVGTPVFLCSNKKGLNSPIRFQVRKFNFSSKLDPRWAKLLEPYKYDMMQWLHDELAKTGKLSLLSPELDWLAQGWDQYLSDCESCAVDQGVERDELAADYGFVGLLLKVTKEDLSEGRLDKWVAFISYTAAAIKKLKAHQGEVEMEEGTLKVVGTGDDTVSGHQKIHMVKGKTTTDLEIAKDSIQVAIRNLAAKVADAAQTYNRY